MADIQKEYEAKRDATAALIRQFASTGSGGEDVVKATQEQLGIGIQFGMLDGVKQECERYLRKADAMIAKTGEFVFSRQEFETSKQALTKKQIELMTNSNVLAGQTETAFKAAEKEKNLNRRRKKVSEFTAILDDYIKATITTAMIVGALNKNNELVQRLDALLKAAGGVKSEAVLMEAYESRLKSAA